MSILIGPHARKLAAPLQAYVFDYLLGRLRGKLVFNLQLLVRLNIRQIASLFFVNLTSVTAAFTN